METELAANEREIEVGVILGYSKKVSTQCASVWKKSILGIIRKGIESSRNYNVLV